MKERRHKANVCLRKKKKEKKEEEENLTKIAHIACSESKANVKMRHGYEVNARQGVIRAHPG